MSQKRQADSVPEENKTKMSRVANSVSRMSDVMSKLFRFQDGSEYQYSITPNTLYTQNIIVYLFFTGEGENIQVLFAQLPPPPPQPFVIEQEDEEEDDDDNEFLDSDLFETDLFDDDSNNDLFVW